MVGLAENLECAKLCVGVPQLRICSLRLLAFELSLCLYFDLICTGYPRKVKIINKRLRPKRRLQLD
jgi:hypothetical protein